MRSSISIQITGCHAEGEVGDVITGGVAPPPGSTIWEQSRWIAQDGARRSFRLTAEDESVTDAAARAGMDLPYACANGMCATCRCKLAEGEAGMVQNFSLEPWEQEAGFILACQAQPKSSRIVQDFDAV